MNRNQARQGWLSPAQTPVHGNCDYHRRAKELEEINRLLRESSVLSMAIDFALEGYPQDARPMDIRKRMDLAERSLRCELLRHRLGKLSFREFSRSLAGHEVYADFCGLRDIRGVHHTSKSALDRASKSFTPGQLREMFDLLNQNACNFDFCGEIGLAEPVDSNFCLVDSTCLEANIHFPTDWVLLRDVSRTLLKAVKLIREKGGLLHRMPGGPEAFAKMMNDLCKEMTFTNRRKDGKKLRKKELRKMKTLLRRIGKHAKEHRDLLEQYQGQTDWSKKQAANIIARIDRSLALVPKVIHQAHERIIGGRLLPNDQKILSAYDPDLHTIKRGKAGKDVEFGNGLYIAENFEGYLLDYKLYKDYPPADDEQLLDSLRRQKQAMTGEKTLGVVGDRQFSTKKVAKALEEAGAEDWNCPRNPSVLMERQGDPMFKAAQKRRAGTEARIAIIKNNGGRVWRSKSFHNRSIEVGFAALGHNLQWLARAAVKQEAGQLAQAA